MVSSLVVLTVVVLLVVLAGALLWRRHSTISSLRDWESRKHEIDLRAFEALLDHDDEARLRECLSSQQFRYFQRRRIRLALRFLSLMEENAAMLMSLAQHARRGQDIPLSKKADEMIVLGLQLRLKMPLVKLYLSVKWLLPSWSTSLPSFQPSYRELLNCMVQFQQQGQQALP